MKQTSDRVPPKMPVQMDTYPGRWAAATACWRTNHRLCLDRAKDEMEVTGPADSRIWGGCRDQVAGPCALAGGDFQGQNCQRLLSTEERKGEKNHSDDEGDPLPIERRHFSIRTDKQPGHPFGVRNRPTWIYFIRRSQWGYKLINYKDWKKKPPGSSCS